MQNLKIGAFNGLMFRSAKTDLVSLCVEQTSILFFWQKLENSPASSQSLSIQTSSGSSRILDFV